MGRTSVKEEGAALRCQICVALIKLAVSRRGCLGARWLCRILRVASLLVLLLLLSQHFLLQCDRSFAFILLRQLRRGFRGALGGRVRREACLPVAHNVYGGPRRAGGVHHGAAVREQRPVLCVDYVAGPCTSKERIEERPHRLTRALTRTRADAPAA